MDARRISAKLKSDRVVIPLCQLVSVLMPRNLKMTIGLESQFVLD